MFIGSNLRNNDCAIVATRNAFIWQGKKPDYLELDKRARKRKYGYSDSGFPTNNIKSFLLDSGIKCRAVSHFTTQQLEKHLLKGNAVMLSYWIPGSPVSHMVMAKSENGKTIELVNSTFTWIELVLKIHRKEAKITSLMTIDKGEK